ncbi:SGNH/GDSL hydrolase family protein [Rhizobium pisi]|uniref:SGNH/GDSL hydrolase family protein n=1 Tax=Rhizobium pisi TaxID=574561 RepID=UPI00103EFDE0|nr:SGNH/GDSL hydrolase family protein [Rhizobium pisi]TCA48552.1 SGNH/GDSL hydrolase family protein [Rhizobium pisi]
MIKTLLAFSLALTPSLAWSANYYEPHFQSRMMTIAVQTWGIGPGAVMLLGDSNTEMFRPTQVGNCQVINAGFGGARIADIRDRAASLADIVHPSIVHIMIGSNDIGQPSEGAADALAETVEAFKQRGASVTLWAIPPINTQFGKVENANAVNKIIANVAKAEDVSLVDDWAQEMIAADGYAKPNWIIGDGVHLSPNAQRIRETRIAQIDADILKTPGKTCKN